ncbi:hypothetical protein ACH5RR_012719 [Cinchona calisaya]|uniref:NAC domain-containing protein n=1 Tax=Cinchona calisaya TaxID=153742 RepID=A0ABD3AEC5_9GENT
MARTSLPPGFRFHPTDVELVMYYLKRKVMGKKLCFQAISELNIYKFSPWDLPDKSCLKSKDLEWFFFCPRERKYACGDRMNRATETGYWKTTGKDRPVVYNHSSVGMVKTLVFHQGNAPRGQRTDWVIHEYRIEDKNLADMGVAQDTYVLCKVFHKSGPGPQNGSQYGAPFKEEDWDDDEDFSVGSSLPDGPSPIVLVLPENVNASAAMICPGNAPASSLNELGPSLVEASNDEVLLVGQNSSTVTSMVDPRISSGRSLSEAAMCSAHDTMILDTPDNDILRMLAAFSEDSPFLTTRNESNELGGVDHGKVPETAPQSDGSDPFNGLEDLSNLAELNGGGLNSLDSLEIDRTTSNMLLQDDTFLELDDLAAPLIFSSEFCTTEQTQTSGLYRSCSFSGSEQILAGNLGTHYNIHSDLGQCWSGGNFSGCNPHLIDLHQLSAMPDLSDRQGNSTNVFQTGKNVHQGTNVHNLDFTCYRQEEEIINAAGEQERGVQQRNFFSRLQQLLESIPADPASAAYDGSSIHVKAEASFKKNDRDSQKWCIPVTLGEYFPKGFLREDQVENVNMIFSIEVEDKDVTEQVDVHAKLTKNSDLFMEWELPTLESIIHDLFELPQEARHLLVDILQECDGKDSISEEPSSNPKVHCATITFTDEVFC